MGKTAVFILPQDEMLLPIVQAAAQARETPAPSFLAPCGSNRPLEGDDGASPRSGIDVQAPADAGGASAHDAQPKVAPSVADRDRRIEATATSSKW